MFDPVPEWSRRLDLSLHARRNVLKSSYMNFPTRISRSLERERGSVLLVACALAIAASYVLLTFDGVFLLGLGPFWANPRGPWLMDADGVIDSIDILTTQVAYTAFLHAPWGIPLFFVPDLGPNGSSVILVDAVPIVALLGKSLFWITGIAINPYGLWVGSCFLLSALFATLLMIEVGETSLLGAIAATLLAVSMPVLLYRFGHLSLLGQFIIIGGLWLYMRDRRVGFWQRLVPWTGWLCLAALLHGYLFAMAAALYAAAWLRRLDSGRWSARAAFAEFALVSGAVALLLVIAGHFGKGTGISPTGVGYGYFSMNLLSPIWPQRSGLFPNLYSLKIGPDGQYEGFNYLGAGCSPCSSFLWRCSGGRLLELCAAISHCWSSSPISLSSRSPMRFLSARTSYYTFPCPTLWLQSPAYSAPPAVCSGHAAMPSHSSGWLSFCVG